MSDASFAPTELPTPAAASQPFHPASSTSAMDIQQAPPSIHHVQGLSNGASVTAPAPAPPTLSPVQSIPEAVSFHTQPVIPPTPSPLQPNASPSHSLGQPYEQPTHIPSSASRDFTAPAVPTDGSNQFHHVSPAPPAAPSGDFSSTFPTPTDITFATPSSIPSGPSSYAAVDASGSSLKRDTRDEHFTGGYLPNGSGGNGIDNSYQEHVAKRAKVDSPPPVSNLPFTPAAQYYAPYSQTPLYPPVQTPVSHQPPQTYDSLPLSSGQKKHFLSIVRSLKKLKEAYAFLLPVDPIALNVPTYYHVVSHPMDLSTIEHKLLASGPKPKGKADKGKYMVKDEVIRDFRLVWENSARFNGEDHAVTQAGRAVEAHFESALKKLPPDEAANKTPSPAPRASQLGGVVSSGLGQAHGSPHGALNGDPAGRRNSTEGGRPKREIHPTREFESDSKKKAAISKKGPQDPQLKFLLKHVDELMSKKAYSSWASPFHYPVDTVALNIPEYNEIVKRPMDLNTIRTNLLERVYDEPLVVNADIQLMIHNCFLFNPPLSPVHNSGMAFKQHWEENVWNRLPPKEESSEPEPEPKVEVEPEVVEPESDDEGAIAELDTQIAALQAQRDVLVRKQAKKQKSLQKKAAAAAATTSKPSKPKASKAPRPSGSKPSKKNSIGGAGGGGGGGGGGGHSGGHGHSGSKPKKSTTKKSKAESEEENVVMLTQAQKQELAEKITTTEGETLSKAINIIQESMPMGEGSEEIELDIESLPPAIVLRLYNLVVKKAKRKGTGKGNKGGTGGLNRKTTNEDAESEKIRQLEENLKQFERPASAMHGVHAVGSDSESESGSSESDSDSE